MNLLDIVGTTSDLFGFLGGIFATLAWAKLKAQDTASQKIKVFLSLNSGDKKIKLPLHMRRGDLTRAEFLGRMGMIPMKEKGERFSLNFLFSENFLKGINEISDGKTSELIIPCSQEEINQFDL